MDFVLHPVDQTMTLARVLARLPLLDLDKGPFVAGGAVRRLYSGEPFDDGDVDLFLCDASQTIPATTAVLTLGTVLSVEQNRPNPVQRIAVSLGARGGVEVDFQVVKMPVRRDIAELFESFDFTVCCFATDGQTIITTREAIEDLRTRTLRPVDPSKRAKKNLTHRLSKYARYGFTPDPSVLTWMLGPEEFMETTDTLVVAGGVDHEY